MPATSAIQTSKDYRHKLFKQFEFPATTRFRLFNVVSIISSSWSILPVNQAVQIGTYESLPPSLRDMSVEQPMIVDRLITRFLHHLAILESDSEIESVSFTGLSRYQSPVVTHREALS